MIQWIALGISGIALVVSVATAWLTLLRTGKLQMTQPTVVFFGPDGGLKHSEKPRLKVFLRTLLYSTSQRGQTIESIHVNIQRAESKQNFSIWVYGDDRLSRGSGLYVGTDGVATNHHFLLPQDGADFKLVPGQYTVRVFAKRVSDRNPRQLLQLNLLISEAQAKELENDNAGIYFDWGPDQQAYHAHVEILKSSPLPPWLLDAANR
jgi:hypothetical protein